MNHLIVGYGEIGKAVHDIIDEQSIDIIDEGYTTPGKNRVIDIMHICFPYDNKFIDEVNRYMSLYEPAHTIIYSTVAIGTTLKLPNAVHSPVEGKHPNLASSMRIMPRWIGADDKEERAFFEGYFAGKGIQVRAVNSTLFTEFLKLRNRPT